ncbi:MAG: hypothetical protein ABRQ25_07165 [Clostridiaceae bacterium]
MLIKQELKKALFNKKLLFIILVGVALHAYSGYEGAKSYIYFDFNASDIQTPEAQKGAHEIVKVGLNKYNVWSHSSALYSLFMPIMVAMCYGTSYFEDIKSGFVRFIDSRVKHREYIISKYFVNGLIGGISLALPSMVYFLLLCIVLTGDISTATAALGGIFQKILLSNPPLYLCIYFSLEFLFGFAYSTIALAVSTFIKNKIAILLSPAIYFFVVTYITDRTKFDFMCPSNTTLFWAIAGGVTAAQIVSQLMLITVVFTIIFMVFSRKKVIYE